ncbi:MAG: alkaline phosphatase family protein [Dehalococcoidia bacterium]
MRCILIVLDGLGDRGHRLLNGKTPLQAASTPNLDRIAEAGISGLYHPLMQGIALPSESAHFLMFGYNMADMPGRGMLEAIGDGIPVNSEDVAILARLFSATLEGNKLIIQNEKPDIDEESAYRLQQCIEPVVEGAFSLELVPRKGIEGILLLRGGLSTDITDSNPVYAGRPIMKVRPLAPKENEPGAIITADLVNTFLRNSHLKLTGHPINERRMAQGRLPVNALATQRAGGLTEAPSFEKRWGMKALSLSSGSVYRGICSFLGIENRQIYGAADHEEDLLSKLKAAHLETGFDFIHVHTKAPDEAAHTKNPEYKKEVIEALDRALAFAIDEIIPNEDNLLVITADHSTPSSGRMIHSGESVPLTMVGPNTRKDAVTAYDEVTCSCGGLGTARGRELMYLILNFTDRGKLWGLIDSPDDEPYFPGHYESLEC